MGRDAGRLRERHDPGPSDGLSDQAELQDGELVKKGQVLFEIDPRTFEAALAQAKGTLDQAKGTVDQSKAGWRCRMHAGPRQKRIWPASSPWLNRMQ